MTPPDTVATHRLLPPKSPSRTARLAGLLQRGPHVVALSALLCVIAVLYVPMLDLLIAGQRATDYPAHIALAEQMERAQTVLSPHFLYQLLLIIVHSSIRGISLPGSALIVSAALYMSLAVILY